MRSIIGISIAISVSILLLYIFSKIFVVQLNIDLLIKKVYQYIKSEIDIVYKDFQRKLTKIQEDAKLEAIIYSSMLYQNKITEEMYKEFDKQLQDDMKNEVTLLVKEYEEELQKIESFEEVFKRVKKYSMFQIYLYSVLFDKDNFEDFIHTEKLERIIEKINNNRSILNDQSVL